MLQLPCIPLLCSLLSLAKNLCISAMESKNSKWPKDWKDHPDLVKTAEQVAMVESLALDVPQRVLKDIGWIAWGIGDKSKAEIASRSKIEISQQDLYPFQQDQQNMLYSRRIALLQKDTEKAQPTDAPVAQECKSFSWSCAATNWSRIATLSIERNKTQRLHKLQGTRGGIVRHSHDRLTVFW